MDGDTEAESTPPPSLGQRVRRLPRKVVIGGAALLAVAGAVLIFSGPDDDPAAAAGVARDFLEAVRGKDVDRAFEIAGTDRQSTKDGGAFLAGEAPRGDWRVGEVEPRSHEEIDDVGAKAVVRYDLSMPKRPELRGYLELTFRDGRWTIDNPTVGVKFRYSPLRYVDVNGVRVPREYLAEPGWYYLLPGYYDFYASKGIAGLETAPTTMAIGEENPDNTIQPTITVTPEFRPSDEWWTQVDRGVAAVLQTCVQQTVLSPPGCPFSAARILLSGEVVETVDETAGIRWEVVRQPVIHHGSRPDIVNDSIQLASPATQDGIVRMTGTGTTSSGARVRFTCEAPVEVGQLAAGVEADGTVVVDAFEARYGQGLPYGESCREPDAR